MHALLMKFTPPDIIALIVIVGGLILKFSGADGVVGTLLTVVVGFYFGRRATTAPLDSIGGGQSSAPAPIEAKKH